MQCGTICVHGVRKRFGVVQALAGADFCVERGELVALLGPSGCGKTTLLRLVAGFETPDEGEICLEGATVADHRRWVPPERRRVGFVFQDYALFPHLTVGENVGFGIRRRERRRRVAEVLELVGLVGEEQRYPHELSGGQQQRVALARALAPAPSTVLLDEPWSNIDPLLRHSMRDELAAILRAAGTTTVLVTHDREEAFSIADRIAVMREGAIVQAGPPEEVYLHPVDRWSAEFVGAGNFVPGQVDGDLVETLLGRFGVANRNGARSVRALIRPELLELRTDPAGPAEVVGREFRGHDVFYRVRLAGGLTLVSQRPSTEVVPLGARVTVHAHPVEVPVFPQ
jgi:iron(III) transport system ATP-binding protein